MDDKQCIKTHTNFSDEDEWREYFERTVPAAYTLAFRRTTLFARFYEVRNQTFPHHFCAELAEIVVLQEPGRTSALEALNGRIFSDITQLLSAAVRNTHQEKPDIKRDPRQLIDDLLGFLVRENPFFGAWVLLHCRGRCERADVGNVGQRVARDYSRRRHRIPASDGAIGKTTPLLQGSESCSSHACMLAELVSAPSGGNRAQHSGAGCRAGSYGGASSLRVRVVSFGTNWWAMHSRDRDDPYCFRRHAAWFNSAGLHCGRRLRLCWVYRGQIRFNQTSGFEPDFPHRSLGRTFLCSGPNYLDGRTHLLFSRLLRHSAADCQLVTVNERSHGGISFHSRFWKSPGVRPISICRRGLRYEAMLLMGPDDWIETELGQWLVSNQAPRLILAQERGK